MIVSASTQPGEAGYLTLDWHALADEIGGPLCVDVVEVQKLIHFLGDLGFDSTYSAAEAVADQLAPAALAAEWSSAWNNLALLGKELT